MSRDLVRACAIGRAATLRRGPGPAGVRADGLFSPAGWDTPTWAQATCGGRVPTCRANACGGRPAATSVSRPASAHGLRKSGLAVPVRPVVVRAAPTLPGVSRFGLPPASAGCCDSPPEKASHLLTVRWRLVAHALDHPAARQRHEAALADELGHHLHGDPQRPGGEVLR